MWDLFGKQSQALCSEQKPVKLSSAVQTHHKSGPKKASYIVGEFGRIISQHTVSSLTVNVADRNYSGKPIDFCTHIPLPCM